MLFQRKNILQEGSYKATVTSYSVLDENTEKERILINVASDEGTAPVISYSAKGYDMLNQALDFYNCATLDDLVGKEIKINITQNDEYLNCRISINKESSAKYTDEPAF